MKAIVQDGYGGPEVLALREIDKPTAKDDEVLVRVRAASVHPDVWHVMTGRPYILRLMGSGVRRPKKVVPGTDMAGQVDAVGGNVTRFKVGDEVFGETLSGFSWANGGTFAQFVAVRQDWLAHKPENVSFEQAAGVPTSGLIALRSLRSDGRLRAGQKVLVNGAAGGVGAIALQLAKAFGAEVTGVDTTSKLDLIRSLGADYVIDYTKEDFTRGTERYDLIVDVPGNHRLSAVRRALTPAGIYVLVGHDHFGAGGRRVLGSLPRFMGLMARSIFVKQLPRLGSSMPSKQEAMEVLREQLASGGLTPVVDKVFPLSEAREAMRYLISGQAHGRVAVAID